MDRLRGQTRDMFISANDGARNRLPNKQRERYGYGRQGNDCIRREHGD